MSNLKGNELKNFNDKSFIVVFWERIFHYLSYISLFFVVCKIKRKKLTTVFVEKWVLFNLTFSILSSLLIYHIKIYHLAVFFIAYGLLRAFEVIVYQINVLLFDPYRSYISGRKYRIKSPTRSVILLLHNYVELIFWYATVYISLTVLAGVILPEVWSGYIKASAFCFVNSDLTFISKISIVQKIQLTAYFEMTGGMIMTLISLARFIGLLPHVESVDDI